jgi:methylated-DNA-[protein]-cysteine S-methyltransferase
MKSLFFYEYPIGRLGIAEEDGAIPYVFFPGTKTLPDYGTAETPLIKRAAGQLGEYFAGKRKEFDLPLALKGTDFQVAVWKAMQDIPCGKTRSYRDIATLIGRPKACRAVGMASNRNPIVIIVPCHRVLGQDGSLTGYGGGLPVKQYLLELEKASFG